MRELIGIFIRGELAQYNLDDVLADEEHLTDKILELHEQLTEIEKEASCESDDTRSRNLTDRG